LSYLLLWFFISALPNCPNEYTYRAALRRRYKFLRTPQTIGMFLLIL